jgi:aminomethyltransferase
MAITLQPADSAAAAAELDAILHGAAIAPLDDIGWIRVTGSDRLRWLNGMVTNSIPQLAPGEGCYNFVLNAQGRIQGDLTAFLLQDSILLETGRDQVEKLLAHLNHFIIMDDVELADISAERRGLSLAGPRAAALLRQIGLPAPPLSPMHKQTANWRGSAIEILHAHSPCVPRFELWADSATIAALTADLIAAGADPVTPVALEQLRILEGTPRYGTDIGDRDLPQETSQTRALHFTKGCYLGQEIVERIHSRGSVHRAFTGFALAGTLPAPGTVLETEGKPAGELTSVAAIQLPESDSTAAGARPGPVQLALGTIRREALENAQARNLILTYPGGTATPIALPYAIP